MSVVKKDRAIVLHSRNYGEADRIVTLFLLEGGKRIGMAKGARRSQKRFGSGLEPGSIVEVIFRESPKKEWLLLEEALPLAPNLPLWRQSWQMIAIVGYVLELAARLLPEQQESKPKFHFLENFLTTLKAEAAANALLDFEFQWLKLCGWEPDLETCGFCGLEMQKTERQEVFDHYWEHILGKPLLAKKLLKQAALS